ncbi:MAG: hypothetical protein K9G11_03260 [Rickettsiaceae bacterium]|nr:hypothetical protein [Rickettsiaceae bacterium]
MQARNDAITLPLEDVSSFIIELLECLDSQAIVSSRSLLIAKGSMRK